MELEHHATDSSLQDVDGGECINFLAEKLMGKF